MNLRMNILVHRAPALRGVQTRFFPSNDIRRQLPATTRCPDISSSSSKSLSTSPIRFQKPGKPDPKELLKELAKYLAKENPNLIEQARKIQERMGKPAGTLEEMQAAVKSVYNENTEQEMRMLEDEWRKEGLSETEIKDRASALSKAFSGTPSSSSAEHSSSLFEKYKALEREEYRKMADMLREKGYSEEEANASVRKWDKAGDIIAAVLALGSSVWLMKWLLKKKEKTGEVKGQRKPFYPVDVLIMSRRSSFFIHWCIRRYYKHIRTSNCLLIRIKPG